jgi:hemerythrin-like domain-containing protein
MIEHRLIEKLIAHVARAVSRAQSQGQIDPLLVDRAVDFVRMYADRTHHGKEEDILFRDLEKKALSGDDARVMQELVDEHKIGREAVGRLVEANRKYREGSTISLKDMLSELSFLVEFYPKHIRKEDKVFFPASMRYFSAPEKDAMLEEMWGFDRAMIHEKYRRVVEEFERRVSRGAV